MSKYIITGSIGHISKPIVEALVKAKHEVTVITSKKENVAAIESLGAKAAVGSVADATFIKNAFQGADVAYTMIPPIWNTQNWRASQNEVAKNYIDAIKASSIKYVVNLSSIGAHLGNGCGPVDGAADLEKMLNELDTIKVAHLRPSFFYYNLFNQIGMLKGMNILGANYGGGSEKIVLVHTSDIAEVAIEKLLSLNFDKNTITYISSDERTGAEIAKVLSIAVGKNASWVEFTDEQAKAGMLQAGLGETHASSFVEMGHALRTGLMQVDYWKSTPVKGKIKLEDFAKEFAAAYNA